MEYDCADVESAKKSVHLAASMTEVANGLAIDEQVENEHVPDSLLRRRVSTLFLEVAVLAVAKKVAGH